MIRVNGVEEPYEEGLTIQAYLERNGYRMDWIAVERNGAIVPKRTCGDTLLEDGDTLEVVNFVGGG